MTTPFAAVWPEMDLPHLDDKMEVGTPSYPQLDDIDFDFEPPRQQSVDGSMVDDLETADNLTDPMQADADEAYRDDHMFDDETVQQQAYDRDLEDLNMESYEGEDIDQHDEEILYDEDMGSVDMIEQQNIEHVEDVEKHVEHEESHPETEIQIHHSEDLETFDPQNTNTATQPNEFNDSAQEHSATITSEKETQPDALSNVSVQTKVIDFATQSENGQTNAEGDESANTTQTIPLEEDYKQSQPDVATQTHQSPSTVVSVPEPVEQAEEIFREENKTDKDISAVEDSTNTSTQALHPVTVVYLGQEMSLFPPMMDDSSATFFLSDANLAHEPIETLLASCRDILGETLEHDDELVLDVPSLGLHICEDSKYASQITLTQVVDVYVNLSRNEKLDHIEPLYCSLSSRVCLGSQYAYLTACATQGKTYSEIAADYADSPDHDTEVFQDTIGDQQTEEVEQGTFAGIQQVEDNTEDDHEPFLDQNEQEYIEKASDRTSNTDIEGIQALDSGSQPAPLVKAEMSSAKPGVAETSEHTVDSVDSHHGPVVETHHDVESKTISPASEKQDATEGRQDAATDGQVYTHNGDEHFELEVDSNAHPNNVEDTDEPTDPILHGAEKLVNSALPDDVDEPSPAVHADHSPEDALKDDVENAESDDQSLENDFYQYQDGDGSNGANDNVHNQAQVDAADNGEVDELTLETVETEFTDKNDADQEDDLDLFAVDDVTADVPITPSKSNGSKRKALDGEDELDFLDFDTPEPKRTRAS